MFRQFALQCHLSSFLLKSYFQRNIPDWIISESSRLNLGFNRNWNLCSENQIRLKSDWTNWKIDWVQRAGLDLQDARIRDVHIWLEHLQPASTLARTRDVVRDSQQTSPVPNSCKYTVRSVCGMEIQATRRRQSGEIFFRLMPRAASGDLHK